MEPTSPNTQFNQEVYDSILSFLPDEDLLSTFRIYNKDLSSVAHNACYLKIRDYLSLDDNVPLIIPEGITPGALYMDLKKMKSNRYIVNLRDWLTSAKRTDGSFRVLMLGACESGADVC